MSDNAAATGNTGTTPASNSLTENTSNGNNTGETGGSTTQNTPNGNSAWYGSLEPDVQGWLENKGYKADQVTPELLTKAVRGHYNAEKMIGVPVDQLLRLPKDEDPKQWDAIYNRLGRPADPKEYKIELAEGQDPALTEAMKPVFHKYGLTSKQAEGLAKEYNAVVGGLVGKMNETKAVETAKQAEALKSEWGAAYEKNLTLARGAVKQFGFDAPTIDKLEQALGFDGVHKMLAKMGATMGEDKFLTGESGNGFGAMSPAAAQQKIAELKRDPNWTNRYLSGGKDELAEMRRLMEMAYAGRK